MNKKINKPKLGIKRYRVHDADDTPPDLKKPIFSLSLLGGDYCLSKCERAEKASFADTLYRLSQLTWVQLRQADKHGLGYEKIERTSINAGIPNSIKDRSFIAFRFHGKAPMVGYRDQQVFYVVWIDRDFSLYNHG
ncbi:MAG: hypothetical protein HQK57_03915 [Deltaproteobacteria bacterium]|nr:hypothetical protein [Deltaproteobacteria bacterium]